MVKDFGEIQSHLLGEIKTKKGVKECYDRQDSPVTINLKREGSGLRLFPGRYRVMCVLHGFMTPKIVTPLELFKEE